MRRRVLILAAVLAAACAPAALAQEGVEVPAAEAPGELNVREAALQTLADAFARQTRTVTDEINAVLDAGGDEAEARARIEAILVPFERLAGSFSEEVAGFIRWQADEAETPEARDEALSAIAPVVEAIAGLPTQLRIRANTALSARAEAEASTAP